MEEALPGDLVTIAGLGKSVVNNTICNPEINEAIPVNYNSSI